MLVRITKGPKDYFTQTKENFLAALAPIASSAQSKKIVESIVASILDMNIESFPTSLNQSQTFWQNNKKYGLYNALCEHGKNLNWDDANQLAAIYFNTSKTAKDETAQLLMLCAFGNKIDKKLLEPVTVDLINTIWELSYTTQGPQKTANLCWLSDLNYFTTSIVTEEKIKKLIERIPSHMQEIKNSYTHYRNKRSGAMKQFYALASLFQSLSIKLSHKELDDLIDHLSKNLNEIVQSKNFNSNADLALEFLCSLNTFAIARANMIIELCLLSFGYKPNWVLDKEDDFNIRRTKYFSRAIQYLDENQLEKNFSDMIIVFEYVNRDSSYNNQYLCECLDLLFCKMKPEQKQQHLESYQKILDEVNKKIPEKDISDKQSEIEIPNIEQSLQLTDPVFHPSYKERFPSLNSEQKEQFITSMLDHINNGTKISSSFPKQLFDLISEFPNSISEPKLIKILKTLGYSKESDLGEGINGQIRYQAFNLVVRLISINRIPFDSYRFLFSGLEKQTNAQFMAAIYFKLHLRVSNLSGFFFCLDRDYHCQKNNEKTAHFFSGHESAKLAAYAQQEVLAIVKTIETKEEKIAFLKPFSSLSIFENYKLYDGNIEFSGESSKDEIETKEEQTAIPEQVSSFNMF